LSTKAETLTLQSVRDLSPSEFTFTRRDDVLRHLDEILHSRLFGSSKRYAALLRYVVEQTLDGKADHLKERTIGVEAFGRAADYDTNVDHSVRSAAGEVRRRLSLFYAESSSDSNVRIELQPGSYVPQIRFLDPILEEGVGLHVVAPQDEYSLAAGDEFPSRSAHIEGTHERGRWFAANVRYFAPPFAVAALLLFALTLRSAWQQRNPFDDFWNPILASPNQALLCFGGGRAAAQPPVDGTPTLADFDRAPARRMNVSDAMALVALTSALDSAKKPFRILNRASSTSFKDLQQGPFILIGGMNNEWTLRLLSGLRFTFDHTATGARVADKRNPSNTAWSFTYSSPIDQPVRDYAIITRLHDAMTDQSGVIVAGIGSWGTQAAAEFAASPSSLKRLASMAPSDWGHKNLQVVIGTDVIQGSSGPPIVLAAHFW
jgi:hypothetical protein